MMVRRKARWAAGTATALLISGGLMASGFGGQTAAPKPKAQTPATPQKAEVGKPFKNFTLVNLMATKKGDKISLSSFKGKQPVVLVFMANRCGTTWTYEGKIGQLLKEYKGRAQIMAVHANFQEPDSEIVGQMEQRNLDLPVLDDKKEQALVQYVGARVTPTFLVIDKAGVLRFQGSFDKINDDNTQYVRPALDAILAGKPVAVSQSRAFG